MRRKVAYTTRRPAEALPGVEQPIAHAGTGATAGSAAGGPGPHPQNRVEPTRAGHGQGTSGGAIDRPQDKVKPSSSAKQPNPVDPKTARRATPAKEAKGSRRFTGGERKNLGHFLGKVARGTGRPA